MSLANDRLMIVRVVSFFLLGKMSGSFQYSEKKGTRYAVDRNLREISNL